MKPRRLKVRTGAGASVSSVWLVPDRFDTRGGACLALAHGAGNDMESPFMTRVHRGIAARGVATVRFNFPYTEAGRKAPDPPARLEDTWRCVLERVRREIPVPAGRVFAGGKSMGGRIASRVVAGGHEVGGLVFLGYPLHPAGKPDQIRDAHFPDLRCRCLFVEGTRDPLCDLALLERTMGRIPGPTTLHVIDGGDHSLRLPKRAGRTDEEVLGEVCDVVAGWVSEDP